MSGRSIRRIAVFTPLPPVRSGIATYNHGFLPRLAEHLEVTAFVDDRSFATTEAPPDVSVRHASYFDARRFDLAVFHMGNHVGYHEYVYEALDTTPGLVVLHDMRMTDFFHGLGHRRPELIDVTIPRSGTPAAGIDFAGLAPIVRRARGVLVHSDAHAATLRRCFPGTPVFASRLALPERPSDVPTIDPAMLGWPDSALIVGGFGAIQPHKNLGRLISTVAGLRDAGIDARAVISGWVSDPREMERLETLVARLGAESNVAFFTDTTDLEMCALQEMCDAVIDLRGNLTGASSMSITTALGHGVPVITTALPEFTDVSHPLLRHVSADPTLVVAGCARILGEMAARKAATGSALDITKDAVEAINRDQRTAVMADHLDAIERCLHLPDPPRHVLTRVEARTITSETRPITVVADLTAATGLMEYGRALINVLHRAAVPLTWHPQWQEVAAHDRGRDIGRLATALPQDRTSDTEVWFANINEFPAITADELRPAGPRRRIIASWFWELPVLQEPFLSQMTRVDEIWVGSPFIERTFRQYCDLPITVVPMPIETMPNPHLDRGDFGLSDDVLFYFDFDANSHVARKNPFGLIAAFRQAFSADDRDELGRRPRLVLKSLHTESSWHVRTAAMLRGAMAEIDGIIISDELDRGELDSLVNCCDVYASMHRGEGLGIGMLEAMHLGKPVISPTYPHKWIFPAEVALGVPARMRPIDSTDTELFPEASGAYSEGLPWVEPDVTVAARHMRRLFDQPELRDRLGARGARLVREHYNAGEALRVMSSRLGLGHPNMAGAVGST